jgi:hypothetical protein
MPADESERRFELRNLFERRLTLASFPVREVRLWDARRDGKPLLTKACGLALLAKRPPKAHL